MFENARASTGAADGEPDGRDAATSTAAHGAEQNHLLRALPIEEYAPLMKQLVPVRLRLRQDLIVANEPIMDVYFIRDGVGSMVAKEQEGGLIEVGTIGHEGLVGLPVLFGALSTPYRVFVQVEGEAWRMDADAFRRVVDERAAVRHLFLRYAQSFTDQLAQSVACNRLHTVEERCARWLLMTHDRVHGAEFELTHEFLAIMLGVRRAGVSVTMGALQSAGLVRYARGRVTVVDRERLEETSCACYAITRAAAERVTPAGDTPVNAASG